MNRIYGYPVSFGYMGWVEQIKDFMLFETEGAYKEYLDDEE